jgi:hypothetical protein
MQQAALSAWRRTGEKQLVRVRNMALPAGAVRGTGDSRARRTVNPGSMLCGFGKSLDLPRAIAGVTEPSMFSAGTKETVDYW